MSPLERRYRRLLRLYPHDYRDRYEQEMLGVLLDGAEQGRNRPTLRETADVVHGAVAYRARIAVANLGAGPWRRSAGLAAVVAVATTAALSVSDLLAVAGPWIGYGYFDRPPAGPSVWTPPVVWCLALVATLAGLRRPAAALAGLGLLADLGVIGLQYHRIHGADLSWWRLALATVAVTGLLWTRDLRGGLRLLGWRRGTAVAVLLGWHTGGPYALAAAVRWLPIHLGFGAWDWLVFRFGPVVLAVLLLAVLSVGLAAPVRRRLFAVFGVVGLAGLSEFVLGSPFSGVPQLSAPLQLVVVLVGTVVALGLAAAVVHGRDRAGAARDG